MQTNSIIVTQSNYIRIPAAFMKSPAFVVTNRYEISMDANGVFTIVPLIESRSQQEINPVRAGKRNK